MSLKKKTNISDSGKAHEYFSTQWYLFKNKKPYVTLYFYTFKVSYTDIWLFVH